MTLFVDWTISTRASHRNSTRQATLRRTQQELRAGNTGIELLT